MKIKGKKKITDIQSAEEGNIASNVVGNKTQTTNQPPDPNELVPGSLSGGPISDMSD